jgi:signal transduction histidine kinase
MGCTRMVDGFRPHAPRSQARMVIAWGSEPNSRLEVIARTIIETPFTRRTWSELLFLIVGIPIAFVGFAFVGVTMATGAVLAITFIGLAIVGIAVRGARGIGGMQRRLARVLIDEVIEEPGAFSPRPGYLGWLQSALRDRTGWKAMAYLAIKVPLATVAFLTAFGVWWDAFASLTYPFWGITNRGRPAEWGVIRLFFNPGYLSPGNGGVFVGLATVITGAILFFVAPWPVRFFDYLDRLLMRGLLAPDAMTVRVRNLEQARAQTVDASAATLRAIERDLHDGTQAQLVALAMRLGMAKEKLSDREHLDIDQVSQLVNDAHKGAKEAIVELRDLARGIHPPALDVGLEGALATLAARSTIPTELTVAVHERPSPAIEAIAYFCVAELMANVAQHAFASRASVSCAQQGRWLRLVVRDDGIGGARAVSTGSSSSGLNGLADRVRTVDGNLEVTSPPRGPTVVTLDLPLRA